MGKKIASLYAEISGDTTKLDTALKGTKNELTGMKGVAANMATSVNSKMMSMVAPAALVSGAIYGIKDALDSTVAYAKQVEDLGRLIGASPEEASRLIQVADDVRISYDTMSTAMEGAIRKGFDPSISGLQSLTEKYQSIVDPIEKSKFLMDTFGKAGADMAPLLELPRDRLSELAAEADKAGLALSGKNLEDAKAYALAMDGLDDSIMGVKVALAKELIPSITAFIDTGSRVKERIDNEMSSWEKLLPVLYAIRATIIWIQEATVGEGFAAKTATANPYAGSSNGSSFEYGGFASGGDFTVPPGNSGDGMGFRAQSGEHVKVTQQGVPDDNARLMRNLPTLIGKAVRDGVIMGMQK